MSPIVLQPASEQQLERWDDYVSRSVNGTLFHTRAFLSYHGDRFANTARWMIATKQNDIVALFCYADEESANGHRIALSPFGASYGGFVLKNYPSYSTARALVSALIAHIREANLDGLRITPPISCCTPKSLDTLTFALLEQGFRSICRDVSSVVALGVSTPVWEIVTSRARRNARKAISNGVTVILDASEKDFWVPMGETFSRHAVKPTHDREQLRTLMNLVPNRISFNVAYRNDAPVASVASFIINERVACGFYFAHTEDSKPYHALTLTIMRCMERCQADGLSFYDMGTSTGSMRARPSIFFFKEGFSVESYLRETLEWTSNEQK